MNDQVAGLPYRPCVGIMMVNASGLVFVGKRIDNKEGDAWQMPQGGIDDGEELHPAALRELSEETGVCAELVTIIAESRDEHFYDLPDELLGRLWGGKYRGQRQKWLLLRFAGEDTDIRIDAHEHPEFNEWRWVEPELLPDLIVPFKKRVYRQIVEEFRELI
ncbi:RNA pyrophosphohydrolase [Novosphingobium sp.]|jgi:putative (di)nucleoside polyphosphate hydrolase|uniref:RNA pyrophosphohydrolase n=1 Tax=Novosphingobium sp. TaxID=1874826 RepID=UPI00356A61FD|nr:RNA pyrophosphohydrolase [Novosphingobium sp.]